MPRYELITKTGFAAQGWRRYDSYAFAATDAVAEICPKVGDGPHQAAF
jgi:hypothetical protein